MDTLCRVCTEKVAKCTSLSSKIIGSSSLSFFDFLNKCTTLNAREGDSLPQSLCSVCANAMKTFYSFMKLAEKSDLILREALKRLAAEGRYHGHKESPREETAKRKEITEESEDFNQGDSFHCQPSKSSTGSLPYILDIMKEEPRVSESTSIVAVEDAVNKESENLESNTDHSKESIVEFDDILSCRDSHPANIDTEHTDSEDDVSISLLKKRLVKSGDEADSQRNSCEEITGNKTIAHGCGICGKQFLKKHNLISHLKNHKEKILKCKKCDKEFKNFYKLRQHLYSHADPIKCKQCGKKLKHPLSLLRHMRLHTNGKKFKFKCNLCGKEYSYRDSLNRHMNWHNNPNPFKCESCVKSFSRKDCYAIHIDRFHPEQSKKSGIKHKCDKCSKEFKHKTSLTRHVKVHN